MTPLPAIGPRPPAGNRDALTSAMLVVENSRSYAEMVAQELRERLGLRVTIATSLAAAREAIDSGEDYFLVLTGLVLPDAGQDEIVGFFLDRKLHTVVVSGVYDEALRQRILNRWIIDCVLKNAPDNLDYIVWLVQRLERNRRIAALVVDDSPSARRMTAALLDLYGLQVVEADGGEAALEALADNPRIRLVVVDYQMPGMDGVEFTRRVRALHARDKLAVIGLSGTGTSSLVAQFLKHGANDFITKPFSREEFFCRVSQNIDHLELIGTLQDLATKDFLTGLANRRHFFEQGEQLFAEAQALRKPLAVAILDIDHFKRINDTHGHDIGDAALCAVASTLARYARRKDFVARYGGEEFCMIAPGLSAVEAEAHLEGLRATMARMDIPLAEGDPLKLTVSVGVCAQPMPDLHAALLEADRQLYLAKANGRDRVMVAGQVSAEAP